MPVCSGHVHAMATGSVISRDSLVTHIQVTTKQLIKPTTGRRTLLLMNWATNPLTKYCWLTFKVAVDGVNEQAR